MNLEKIWNAIKDITLQHKEEFLWLLQLIIDKQYKSVLEIGSYKGGTALGFCMVNCSVVCMDSNPQPELITNLKDYTYWLYKIDSRLSSHPITGFDVLFIDGDHSYEGCKSDFETYVSGVLPGGIVVFHDINPKDENNEYGSSVFWNEIKNQSKFEWDEKIVHPETWGGFGILYV